MANVEIQIKTVVDKAISDLKKVSGSVDDVGKSSIDSAGKTTDFSGAITALNQALEIAAKAIEMFQQIHEATVGTFIKYAGEVREMTRATGESAEASSQLIQAADDVGISYDKLKTSLTIAARQGIDTSTESLKELSDQYLKLEPGTQRMTFLLETFGRSGAEMGKLMEQGSEGIDRLTASIEGGLVLSDEILKQARMHEILVDALNDEIEAQKILAGIKIGGIEDDAMLDRTVRERLQTMMQEEAITQQRNLTDQERKKFILQNTDAVREQLLAEIDAQMAFENTSNIINGSVEATEEYTTALDAVTQAQRELEVAQQSWLSGTANEVVSQLQNLNINNTDYMEALQAIDDVMGTNEVGEQNHSDAIEAIVTQYGKTKDIDAFATSLAALRDAELPQTTEKLEEARAALDEVQEAYNTLAAIAENPIDIMVNVIGNDPNNILGRVTLK